MLNFHKLKYIFIYYILFLTEMQYDLSNFLYYFEKSGKQCGHNKITINAKISYRHKKDGAAKPAFCSTPSLLLYIY